VKCSSVQREASV